MKDNTSGGNGLAGGRTVSLGVQMTSVMLAFFAMGFVDLVGIASNYVQKDLSLTDSQANIFPSLVFFWFFIFSVPTGMLMNRIGRKKTVLISLLITFVSLIIPIFGDGYVLMLIAFSLLGIGNAVMQTSLNPLVSNLVSNDRLASTLTFGQFVKAIASCLAPLLAAWGATGAMPTFGLGWRGLFVIFAAVSIISISMLWSTPIHEEKPDKVSGIGESVKLLGKPFILLCFFGIMCHVGIDVGTNTTAPKLLMERHGMALEAAGIATTIYFIFRTAGTFLGGFLLRVWEARKFFALSVVIMLAAMIMLMTCHGLYAMYAGIAMIGFGNSNIFSIIFSQAITDSPAEKNEVSGLMIMGLIGGTIFPLAMGFASDGMGQVGAIAVMTIAVAYLIVLTFKLRKI